MCGINGLSFVDRDLMSSMNSAIIHRGPDGSGVFSDGIITLGHVRLAILDLSDLGSQPMIYEFNDKKIVIVFNGEIYNYLEVKKELSSLGYKFISSTDTEVICAAYIEWGDQCVQKFNGMWAFCIYDQSKKTFLLSKDRLGVKPLYYYFDGNKLIFSSELKGILKANPNSLSDDQIDPKAIELYFSLGYIPAPHTIYKNIYKVEPGSNLKFRIAPVVTKIGNTTFFKLQKLSDPYDHKNLAQKGDELFYDAVKIRMRSDVPVGAFLSGGIDSSAVVSYMRNFTELKKLHTFSIGFNDPAFDESSYINMVQKEFGTIHHHDYFDDQDFLDSFDTHSFHYDEPFADYSAFASLMVSGIAAKNVKVVLSGDGGDELFGGYPLYRAGKIYDDLLTLPISVRKMLLKGLAKFRSFTSHVNKLYELLRLSTLDKSAFHIELNKGFKYSSDSYREWSTSNMEYALYLSDGCMAEALRIYDLLQNTLSNNYLVKVDRSSMAHSIEVRSPFLDYRLAEFAQSIPSRFKVGYSSGKILLKEILKYKVPDKILNRSKMGFTPPISKWIDEALSAEKLMSIIDILPNSQLKIFYTKVFNDSSFRLREYELTKLLIFGNWYFYWINGLRNSNIS